MHPLCHLLFHFVKVFPCITTLVSVYFCSITVLPSRAIPFQEMPLVSGHLRFSAKKGSLFAPSRWLEIFFKKKLFIFYAKSMKYYLNF